MTGVQTCALPIFNTINIYNESLSVSDWSGNDVIRIEGQAGDDIIRDWDLASHIDGGADNDDIFGGGGADILTGGAGNDTFSYENTSDGGDTITDFVGSGGVGDVLEFDGNNFGISDATEGVGWDFINAAVDMAGNNGSINPSFIFDTTGGDDIYELYYDADGGTASGAPILIAIMNDADLTAADIDVLVY